MSVSIALATYNGEKYIVEQLDSLRNQSCKPDEVVIQDDCSKDNTVKLVKKYIRDNKLEKTWRIARNSHNLGYAQNFKTALNQTTGDYIFLCDQDDVWNPDKVKLMVEAMENNSSIKLLCSDYTLLQSTEDAPKISKSIMEKMKYDDTVEQIVFSSHNTFIGSEGCTMCVRKSFYDEIKKYWRKGCAHDEFLWKEALCVDGCYMFHHDCLQRRLHSSNVSKRKIHNIKDRIEFLKRLQQCQYAMIDYMSHQEHDVRKDETVKKNIKATSLRIDMLERKHIHNFFPLLFKYQECYHSRKSLLMEPYIAMKSKSASR